jgi:alpha-amylase
MGKGVMFQYFEWNCNNTGELWRDVAQRAQELKTMGATAVWLPPPYKALDGINDTGYAPYDLYDLGEFDQKGTIRTKYGTREEYLAAITAIQSAGMDAYADIVLDHRLGGDETEEVEIEEVDCNDRNIVIGKSYKIRAWSHFKFSGRGEKYSAFHWHWQHFVAFGYNANVKDDCGRIYRVKGKKFSGEVCFEHGNFDYLMGADVDLYDADVRKEMSAWGRWFLDTSNVNGFRLDAVKHMPASFYKSWLEELRAHRPGRELFAVGEYWSGSLPELQKYIEVTGGAMRLFDVPLHFKLHEASKKGKDFDLSKIFDQTLVKENPLMAVTFVENHDSQPGQALESTVDDWFKPSAYALILLREHGYPCLFHGDYFGSNGDKDGKHKLLSHRQIIDWFLDARANRAHGELRDYFDHPQCIGWAWSGDAGHPGGLAVVMSTSEAGRKKMKVGAPGVRFRDLTGAWPEPVTTDQNGEAEFRCKAGGVSVWIPA